MVWNHYIMVPPEEMDPDGFPGYRPRCCQCRNEKLEEVFVNQRQCSIIYLFGQESGSIPVRSSRLPFSLAWARVRWGILGSRELGNGVRDMCKKYICLRSRCDWWICYADG